MRLPGPPERHLSYCLNVHPGATPEELNVAIFERAPRVFAHVRELTGHPGPYALGLWVSAAVAEHLAAEPERVSTLAQRLTDAGFYVVSLNGFPYGRFHGQRVKENVYLPDWTQRERHTHTMRLARLLAALLPEQGFGTISTVPVTYGAWATPTAVAAALDHLTAAVADLHRLREETGRTINLALEPEPDCFLEDLLSVLAFACDWLQPRGLDLLARHLGTGPAAADVLPRHLGICLDLIHAAVAFEDPATVLAALHDAGLTVAKLHVGAALAVRRPGPPPPELRRFCDEVYLHQTRCRHAGGIARFADLPNALESGAALSGEWRVHYHVPLVWDGDEVLGSTRDLVTPAVLAKAAAVGVRHFEVETYTLGVFPGKREPDEVILARELAWTLARASGGGGQ